LVPTSTPCVGSSKMQSRGLESSLANELETETPVPILIAPPRLRQARKTMAINGARR